MFQKVGLLVGFIGLLLLSCKNDNVEDQTETGTENIPEAEEKPVLPSPEEDYEEEQYKWGFMDTLGRLVIRDNFDETKCSRWISS